MRTELFIQNRSIVPIADVVIRYKVSPPNSGGVVDYSSLPIEEGAAIGLESIPPCVIAKFDLPSIADRLADEPVHLERIEFKDVNGAWSTSLGGAPTAVDPAAIPLIGLNLRLHLQDFQPTDDCGAG